jgi:transcription initiation factor IIF auxiliary subunit
MKGSAKASEGHPWRNWKIRVVAVDNNREKKGKLSYLLDHVEYMLHPTFENPRRGTLYLFFIKIAHYINKTTSIFKRALFTSRKRMG